MSHLITCMIFLPVIGAVIQLGGFAPAISRWLALIPSLLSSACAFLILLSMSPTAGLQNMEFFNWVGSYAINYQVGVDGLNALPILLIAIIFPILISFEWDQKQSPKGMHALFLLVQTSLLGSLCAQDLFLQFFFWGFSALPFYFLIGIWGGPGKEKAAFQSVASAALGNALLFGAFLLIYCSVEPHTFLIRDLAGEKIDGKTLAILGHTFSVPHLSFILISIGLSLRAPIWPFQGWFTQAAREAPSSVFVALASGVVPVAIYLFIRVSYSLFSNVVDLSSESIIGLGAVNLIMGGLCALAQGNLKVLLAFICVSEVGLTLIGVGSLNLVGLVGSIYQQLVLGLSLAGFGLFAGLVKQRVGHCEFAEIGGVAKKAPLMTFFSAAVVASLLGFPGFGGFVGHALLMIGSYAVHPIIVVFTGFALLFATYYLFSMYRMVFLGDRQPPAGFTDLVFRERAYLLPLFAAMLFFGLYPKPLLDLIQPTAMALLDLSP